MNYLLRYASLLTAFLGITILIGCGDDDSELPAPAAPTLSVSVSGSAQVTGTEITGEPGDNVIFTWSATTPAGFNAFRVTQGSTILLDVSRSDLGLEAGAGSASGNPFEIVFDENSIGTSTLELLLVDDDNQTDSQQFNITVTEPASPEARAYSAILLAAPLGDFSGESFFSTNTGEIYSPADVTGTAAAVSPNIDFGYYYGVTDQASLASPNGYSQLTNTVLAGQVAGWNVLNSTTFVSTSIDAEGFLGISTWADIDNAYDNGTNEGNVISNLTEGDVIAFATDASKDGGSKRGILIVRSITPGDGENGRIELDILVQEDAS